MSHKSQAAARRRQGTMHASLCLIMHILQSNGPPGLFSSLAARWRQRWPPNLHGLLSLDQFAADPTVSRRLVSLGVTRHTPKFTRGHIRCPFSTAKALRQSVTVDVPGLDIDQRAMRGHPLRQALC